MAKPKFSVIIPVYNAQEFLKECLDSVINQTLKDIEIICVDDGSTDNSPDILKDYAAKDERIKIITQENLNAGVARNNGIKHATGEYLHFLDADDYLYDENVYKTAYEIIEKKKFPKILRGRAQAFDNDSNDLISDVIYEQRNLPNEVKNKYVNICKTPQIITRLCVTAWIGFVRRDFVLKKKIFFNDSKVCNDNSFFYACIVLAKKIYISSMYIVMHRVNISNSLIGVRDKYFICNIKSYEINKEFFRKHRIKKDIQKRLLNKEIYVILHFYNKYKNHSKYQKKNHLLLIKFLKKINLKKYEPYMGAHPQYNELLELKNTSYLKTYFKYLLEDIFHK